MAGGEGYGEHPGAIQMGVGERALDPLLGLMRCSTLGRVREAVRGRREAWTCPAVTRCTSNRKSTWSRQVLGQPRVRRQQRKVVVAGTVSIGAVREDLTSSAGRYRPVTSRKGGSPRWLRSPLSVLRPRGGPPARSPPRAPLPPTCRARTCPSAPRRRSRSSCRGCAPSRSRTSRR